MSASPKGGSRVNSPSSQNRRLKGQPILDMLEQVRKAAERRNSVKLGLILLGLWVLNWVY